MGTSRVTGTAVLGAWLAAASAASAPPPAMIFENTNLAIFEGANPQPNDRMAVRNVSTDGRFALIEAVWAVGAESRVETYLYDLESGTFSPPIRRQDRIIQISSITPRAGGGYSMAGSLFLVTASIFAPIIIDFASAGYNGEEPILGPCFHDLQDGEQFACNLTNPQSAFGGAAWSARSQSSGGLFLLLYGSLAGHQAGQPSTFRGFVWQRTPLPTSDPEGILGDPNRFLIPTAPSDGNALVAAMTPDARVIVGWSHFGSDRSLYRATRYRNDALEVLTPYTAEGHITFDARAVSHDGRIVVGVGLGPGPSVSLRWDDSGNPHAIGFGGNGLPAAISGDGQLIAGFEQSGFGRTAVISLGNPGVVFELAEYLDLLGIEYPSGFWFHEIHAMNDDGSVLVGYGTFPLVSLAAEKGFIVRLDRAQCNDLVDNDADGLADHPDDPHCASELDDREASRRACGLGSLETAGVLALAIGLRSLLWHRRVPQGPPH